MSAFQVMLLPGSVLPADLAYGEGELVGALGADVETIVKDLEVYREDSPPPDYSLDTEVTGVLRAVDARGWSSSPRRVFRRRRRGAGRRRPLAGAAARPGPARTGVGGQLGLERAAHEAVGELRRELERLPSERFMPAFMRLQVRPGVELPAPPPGPPPPWMRQRPAGIRAFMRTFARPTDRRRGDRQLPGAEHADGGPAGVELTNRAPFPDGRVPVPSTISAPLLVITASIAIVGDPTVMRPVASRSRTIGHSRSPSVQRNSVATVIGPPVGGPCKVSLSAGVARPGPSEHTDARR